MGRLQSLNISAGAPTLTVLSLSYDYHLGIGNDGTIFAITNNIDSNRNRSFTYIGTPR